MSADKAYERKVVVTGAAGGIGRAIALHRAKSGNRVLALDRDEIGLGETMRAMSAIGAHHRSQVVDLCQPDDIANVLAALVAVTDVVDVVVNAAGLWRRGPFVDSDPSAWNAELGTNLVGPMHLLHGLIPLIERSEAGRIVNIISDAARTGETGVAVYAAAKAGLAGFSRCLALEVARYGVTVNCISLSAVDTPGLAESFTVEERARMSRHYPLGRIGLPADVVGAVDYLTSLEASWITGQTLVVNGGYVMA
jgi:2-hydroxycyclohexanecarboxyl-CoA dehydrogenase